MSDICEHGGLQRKCDVCRLTAELATANRQLSETTNILEDTRRNEDRLVLLADKALARVKELEAIIERAKLDMQCCFDIDGNPLVESDAYYTLKKSEMKEGVCQQ